MYGTACGPAEPAPAGGQTGAMVIAPSCQLVVFCGLSGVGKTALSRRVGTGLVRRSCVSTIEAAITSTLAALTDTPVGYVVGSGSGRPVARRTSSGGRRGEQRHGSAARLGDPRAGLRGAPALRPGRVQRQVGASAGSRPGPRRCPATTCPPGSKCGTARGSHCPGRISSSTTSATPLDRLAHLTPQLTHDDVGGWEVSSSAADAIEARRPRPGAVAIKTFGTAWARLRAPSIGRSPTDA